MQRRQEYISIFSPTKIFIWNLIEYVIYLMKMGSLSIVHTLNNTLIGFFAYNVNFIFIYRKISLGNRFLPSSKFPTLFQKLKIMLCFSKNLLLDVEIKFTNWNAKFHVWKKKIKHQKLENSVQCFFSTRVWVSYSKFCIQK